MADLISIKGSTIEFLDPDVKIQKVDPSKRMLRFCLLFDLFIPLISIHPRIRSFDKLRFIKLTF